MTAEERKRIEQGLFKQPEKKAEIIATETKETVLKVVISVEGSGFMWWNEYLGLEIEVYENLGKLFYTTLESFENWGEFKPCNIPKKCCTT